jgi:hypothetical protein
VQGVIGGERGDDLKAFINAHSKSYWQLREMFEQGS